MDFTSKILVERTALCSRASVKEQGEYTCIDNCFILTTVKGLTVFVVATASGLIPSVIVTGV